MAKRFLVLDAFRGLAALCVVVYHMHIESSFSELAFFQGSFAFVELFFVLSGFVLAHAYSSQQQLDFPSFFKARFLRIYPLHLAMFIAFFGFELVKLSVTLATAYQFTEPAFSGSRSFGEIFPNLFLLQSWLPGADPYSYNAPAWSISVEFYLYFILFFSLYAGPAIRRVVWFTLVLLAAYLLASKSSILSQEALRGIFGFFGGVLTYLVYCRIDSLGAQTKQGPSWFGTLLETLAVILIVTVVQTDFAVKALITTGVFYLVILLFSLERGHISMCLKQRPFQYLGKISYSIYLTHVMILLIITSGLLALQRLGGAELIRSGDGVLFIATGSNVLNNLVGLLIILMVIAVSHLSYHRIEARWKKPK